MATPSNFNLEVVKSGLYQPPESPKYVKSDVYDDISVFSEIDDHAILESGKDYPTFQDLVWNLSYKLNLNELERTRAIFRWLTCKDLQKVKFVEVKPNSPELLLSLFKEGKATYARIFECIARHSGLACITISGWAKGVDYHPGVPLTSKPINHSWNAVNIDGSWQLIDCHWATRFLRSEHNSPENLVYEYDDFYFITEPDQLQMTHYPEDPMWLLSKPPQILTKEQFEDYPLLKSYFFASDMHLLDECTRGVHHAKYGIGVVSAGFDKATAYTFKLVYGDKMEESFESVPLTNYVLQQTLERQVVYHIRLPQKGEYYLIIFADVAPDTPNEVGEHIFKAVCEFKIVCDHPAKGNAAFPQCSDVVFGPDVSTAARFGLIPEYLNGLIDVPTGQAEIGFTKRQGEVRVYPRLVKEGIDSAELKKALSIKNDPDKVTIIAKLPQEGEYGLELFANDPVNDGDMFTHVSQYVLAYPGSKLSESYGKIPSFKKLEGRPGAIIRSASSKGDGLRFRYVPKNLNASRKRAFEITGEDGDHSYPMGDSVKKATTQVVSLAPVIPTEEWKTKLSSDWLNKEIMSEPPKEFNMEIKDGGNAPKPDSMTISKQKPFIDPRKVFKDLDAHASQVSSANHESFRGILWHLIFARNITDELDKARAIFLWLCSKDLTKLEFKNYEKGTPEDLLMKLKSGDTTYARVYETLCCYAGLHCKTLTGLAKGAEYKPGMKFNQGQKGQHSWNAVFVNGTWQLVDCHWAARRLVGDQITTDNIRFELDEYYFMPAPSQLIFSHFPDDPTWQLLTRQVSQTEFEHLVPVKPSFFRHGLQLYSHIDAVIDCGEMVTIRIDCPPEKSKSMRFTFNLKYEDGRDKFKDSLLTQFAMLEISKNSCFITIRPPEKAAYFLTIYAKDLDIQTKEGVYGGICEYKIVSSTSSLPNPFPPCVHSSWGPGDSADKFPGLRPLQKVAVFNTVKGNIDIKFDIDNKLRFMAKLKHITDDEKTLAHSVLNRVVKNQVIFHVKPPHVGEFGLEIYVNDPSMASSSLMHAYQYLILCKESSSPFIPFPVLPGGYLGPQDPFDKMGLKITSQEDPYIVNETGEVQMSFGTSQPLRTSTQLFMVTENDQVKDCSNYILQQGNEKGLTFIIKLTQPGFYKFQLFAQPESEGGDSLLGVYNCIINCKSTVASLVPFPKQYSPWREDGYLYEPLEGHLQQNRASKGSASTFHHVYFKLEIPKAKGVAIVIGDDWTQLEQKAVGSPWTGEVDLEKLWENERKLLVCACVDENDDSDYGTFLEYSM